MAKPKDFFMLWNSHYPMKRTQQKTPEAKRLIKQYWTKPNHEKAIISNGTVYQYGSTHLITVFMINPMLMCILFCDKQFGYFGLSSVLNTHRVVRDIFRWVLTFLGGGMDFDFHPIAKPQTNHLRLIFKHFFSVSPSDQSTFIQIQLFLQPILKLKPKRKKEPDISITFSRKYARYPKSAKIGFENATFRYMWALRSWKKAWNGAREVNKINILGGQFLIFLPKNQWK